MKYAKVKKFVRETGASKEQARAYLRFCSWDYKSAKELYDDFAEMLDATKDAGEGVREALIEFSNKLKECVEMLREEFAGDQEEREHCPCLKCVYYDGMNCGCNGCKTFDEWKQKESEGGNDREIRE